MELCNTANNNIITLELRQGIYKCRLIISDSHNTTIDVNEILYINNTFSSNDNKNHTYYYLFTLIIIIFIITLIMIVIKPKFYS